VLFLPDVNHKRKNGDEKAGRTGTAHGQRLRKKGESNESFTRISVCTFFQQFLVKITRQHVPFIRCFFVKITRYIYIYNTGNIWGVFLLLNNAASSLPEVQGKAVEGRGSPAAACNSAFFTLHYVQGILIKDFIFCFDI